MREFSTGSRSCPANMLSCVMKDRATTPNQQIWRFSRPLPFCRRFKLMRKQYNPFDRKQFLLIFSLCQCMLAVFPLTAQSKKTIRPEDIVNLQVVRDVQISPDGKRIAFAAGKRPDFDQLRQSRIWLVPANGSDPRLLHESQHDQTSPRWSQDGRSIAFLSSRSASSDSAEK